MDQDNDESRTDELNDKPESDKKNKDMQDDKNEDNKDNETYTIQGVPVPDDLVRFVVLEKFVPYVTFHDIFKSSVDVDDELNHQENVMESSLFENNKLLLSTRNELNRKSDTKTLSDQKRSRLNRLTKISYSHGISWDTLDNLYFEFFKGKTEAYNAWESNKLGLIQLANQVAFKKISDTKTLNEFKNSGRLIKLFTHKYYNRWFNCYMAPFSPGMLIKYLKAHVTMAVLNRESHEHTGQPLDFKFRQSDKNPYFKEPF